MAAETQACKPQTGVRRWETKEGWLGEEGHFLLLFFKELLRNNPTTKPYVYLIPGPGQKGWGEKKK